MGIGAAVPEAIVTNADLESLVDTSNQWIVDRTGIEQRHIAKDETTAQLAIAAANDAVAYAGIDPSSLELIIVATSTPTSLYASTACSVQSALGATRAAAFDVQAACTGFIYALIIAQQFISCGTYNNILVIGADTHSKFVDWTDRNTCILFGDAAGAVVLTASSDRNDVLATYMACDGSRANLLQLPNKGKDFPLPGKKSRSEHNVLHMKGRPTYEFAINTVPEAIRTVSKLAGVSVSDLDYLIPHQANQRIIDVVGEKLKLRKDQVISNVALYGNTSAASIPLALHYALEHNEMKTPALCALVGFGSGLTWGAAIIRWNAIDHRAQKQNRHVESA